MKVHSAAAAAATSSTSSTGNGGAAGPRAGKALLLTASMGCAMTVLDTNVVGIVLPTIARELNASFAELQWVISAYVLCFAALLLPAGAIADRYGRRRIFLCGIALFAAASLACGLAPSARLLYLARAVQGVGSAFLLAPALAIIGHGFHDERERAQAWAVWGGIMGLTMVLSPLIGGVVNSLFGWRWAFYINLPICAALAAAVLTQIEESRDPTPRTLDLAGIALFATAMFVLTCALIGGPESGWLSLSTLSRAIGGVAFFGVFILVERRRLHPMLDLALFRSIPFIGAVTAMFAYAASAQVMASLLPLYLQNARGHATLAAGIAMLPFALAMLILPQAGRRLARYLDACRILTLGLLLVAAGNLLMAWAADGGSDLAVACAMALLGSGGGLLNGETQKAIMGTVPPQRAGLASGISTTARFTGILLGFSSLSAVLAGAMRHVLPQQACSIRELPCPLPPQLAADLAAGDIERALARYPQWATPLHQLVRHAYAAGFPVVFVSAALLASVAALIVFRCMRKAV